MTAEQSLREGDLPGALAQIQEQVRQQPGNVEYRIFLFQLLSVLGQWARADKQLNVLAELDAATLPMVQTYREALRCEALRADVFAGKRSPLILGDPEQWMALVLQALGLSASGDYAGAKRVRENAFDRAPVTAGSLNGQPFSWLADADSRIGPFLEAIVNGGYYWIPLSRIVRVQLEPPEDLRDMVWSPASFTWGNGGQTVGLIPTRYPGTEGCGDDQCLLSRKTSWQALGDEDFAGFGQRLLATDSDDYALLDIRDIQLDSEQAEPPAEPGER